MSEKKVIDSSISPVSTEDIFRDLQHLGITTGDHLMLHVSLKSMGWVIGAEVALLDAIINLIGKKGTLVMPAQTGNLGDPSQWENPPVPSAWVSKIKATMPAFDVNKTPTYHIGKVAELFRTWPGVVRSNHPHASFTGWGFEAKELMKTHDLDSAFGLNSPLHAMLKRPFKILFIGVDYDVCTALHYAEALQESPKKERKMMVVQDKNERKIIEVMDLAYSTKYFKKIGQAFETSYQVKKGLIGHAQARLVPMANLLEFATEWFNKHVKKT
jgi:aminoglycoside 3-N-acetyltransferase